VLDDAQLDLVVWVRECLLFSLKNMSITRNRYFSVFSSPMILAISCRLSDRVILIFLSWLFSNFS
jgi:hypothetical protein